jgi:hypothetical protein
MNTDEASYVLSVPTIPAELWGLWGGKTWVNSVDDAPGGRTILVAMSEREAVAAAEHQERLYGVTCIPVRLKQGDLP